MITRPSPPTAFHLRSTAAGSVHQPELRLHGRLGSPGGRSTRWLTLPLCSLLLALAAGCAHRNIPNTDVHDSSFNREVVEFCEKYRKAVERRNTQELINFAHPLYYEDGGNADASDDIDYAGLKEHLETRFADAKAIRYEIRYRRVGRGRKDEIYVDYTYSASYKIPTPKGDVWRRSVADNRLELIPEGEEFKIIAGM